MEKHCNGCDKILSTDNFHLHKYSKDGLCKKCKSCNKKRADYLRHSRTRDKTEPMNTEPGEVFKTHSSGLMVSNRGRVFSPEGLSKFVFKRGRFLTLTLMNTGYYSVSCGRGKRPNVHRLVAEAFIANPEGYKCVNHKDLNKLNNNVENLEWCSLIQNIRHAADNDRLAVKLNRQQVLEIRASDKPVKDLSIIYKVSGTNIRYILKRKIWTHI